MGARRIDEVHVVCLLTHITALNSGAQWRNEKWVSRRSATTPFEEKDVAPWCVQSACATTGDGLFEGLGLAFPQFVQEDGCFFSSLARADAAPKATCGCMSRLETAYQW